MFAALLDDLPKVRTPTGGRRCRPGKVHADKADDDRRCRSSLTRRGIKVRIARRGVESSTRLGRHRWKAERTIAWLAGCRRLRVRYDRDSERFFAFAMLGCARLCYNRLPGGGRWASRPDGMSSDLQVGSSGRFQGVYHRHWEWSRFELAVLSRWFPGNRRVLCELVPGAAPFPAALAVPAGRHDPAARFAVTVDADVIAHGRFGHLGTLRWRLLVRRWVAVERLG